MMNNFCDCMETIEKKIPAGDTRQRDVCKKCNKIYYQNPKMVVGVIPQYKDKILLCKRAIEPRRNYWTVPGGFMECGETLKEAALRETLEEAGIEPILGDLHTIYDMPQLNQVYFLFFGKCNDSKHTPGIETIQSKWVDYDSIPWEDIAFEPVKFALKRLYNSKLPVYGILS